MIYEIAGLKVEMEPRFGRLTNVNFQKKGQLKRKTDRNTA